MISNNNHSYNMNTWKAICSLKMFYVHLTSIFSTAKEKDIFPPNCIDVDTEVQNSSRKSPNDTVNSHDWNLDQRQSVMCYQKQEQFNSLLK